MEQLPFSLLDILHFLMEAAAMGSLIEGPALIAKSASSALVLF